jgi:hypothetical protein
MGIVQRIWPRDPVPSALDLSLAERLKELSKQAQSEPAAKEVSAPPAPAEAAPAPAAGQDTDATAVAETNSEADAGTATKTQAGEQETGTPSEAAAAEPGSAAVEEAVAEESHSEIPATEETTPVAAEQEPLVQIAVNPENMPRDEQVSPPATAPEPARDESGTGRGFFRPPTGETKPEEHGNGDHSQEICQSVEESEETLTEGVPLAPASPAGEAGEALLEQLQAAVDRAEAAGSDTLLSVQKALAELQDTRQKFEAEIRDRLDAAVAEYQRRLSSEALANDAAGQFEEKTRRTTEKIFREVKEQSWVMLNAVSGELRSFRDQFGKDVQERVDLLDQTTKQALQVKTGLEEAIPEARDVLQSLPAAGQEATARLQAASAALAEQLQSSRETLSQEIAAQKEALKALLHDCHEDELRLKEEIEKFRTEAGAACDLLGRKADESIERLNAGVDEAGTRAGAGLERVAAEIEQRMLSGDLIENAMGQIEQAAHEFVEPALNRIRNASAEADSVADSLNRSGQDVVDRLGTARQEIETRLGSLMGEQCSMLESSVNRFHHKAAEELGNVVERVVAQSSQQLDERLRALFDDLISSTSEQINSTARATLGSLHDGLKGVFEPEDAAREADSVLLAHRD